MRLYDEENHFRYFQDKTPMEPLLSLIGLLIAKKKNNRCHIQEKTLLTVTLRLLATGDRRVTVAMSFRIVKSIVSLEGNDLHGNLCNCIWIVLRHLAGSQRHMA